MQSRFIQFGEASNNFLEIKQNLDFGYAGEVWDAGLVLTNLFTNNKNVDLADDIQGKVVLELGSGTGICGLTLAALGAKCVYLSDKEVNLKLLEKNYEFNKTKIKNSKVKILNLNWQFATKDLPCLEPIDYIIASDILYDSMHYQDILDVLTQYTAPMKTKVIVSYQYRNKNEKEFFNMVKNQGGWLTQQVSEESLDGEFHSEDIFLLTLMKNQ